MQYGGWYDNPTTGRNQRWFNGVWTDGQEPNSSSGSTPLADKYISGADAETKSIFEQYGGDINKSADGLINLAQGDLDYAIKLIEANYKMAVGSDDAQVKEFLRGVANTLEEKVGRVQFDYETGKYRAESDITTIEDSRTRLLGRLDQDMAVATKALKKTTEDEGQMLKEKLNERGLINGSMNEGLVGEEIRDYDEDVNDRFSALERALSRGKEDTNVTADLSILGKRRDLEDLTTGSRRGIIDAQTNRDQLTGEAQREAERKKREAEIQRMSGLKSVAMYAGQE